MDQSNSTFTSLDYVLGRKADLPRLGAGELAILLNRLGYMVKHDLSYIGGRRLEFGEGEKIAAALPSTLRRKRVLPLFYGSGKRIYLAEDGEWLYVRYDSVLSEWFYVLAQDPFVVHSGYPTQLVSIIREAQIGEMQLSDMIHLLCSAVDNANDSAQQRASRLAQLNGDMQLILARVTELR